MARNKDEAQVTNWEHDPDMNPTVTTEGVELGAEPGTNPSNDEAPSTSGRSMAELEAEIARLQMQRIDPRTNQPMSDFQPTPDDENAARSLELARMARRSGSLDAQFVAAQRQQNAAARNEQLREQNAKAFEAAKEANPIPEATMSVIPPDLYRAREQARVAAEAAALMVSTTIPGGKFMVNGELVNAYGDLIDDNGRVVEKRHRPISG